MVSTGWRTACAVIVILVGAALLTFGIFVWRRAKLLRAGAPHPRPEIQQRFMHATYAFDPEAHTPLLYSEATPPLPPKTQPSTRQAEGERYGDADADEWGFRLRPPPTRVPVPPMYPTEPEPQLEPTEGSPRPRSTPDAAANAIPVPEPSAVHRFFANSALLQFPKIQFTRDPATRRLPSLHIQFLRESNQVVSSPVNAAFPDHSKRASLQESTSSGPSILSRPFATMANSPLPPVAPLSPISMVPERQPEPEPSASTAPTGRNDSITSIGHHLFARATSADDVSEATFSRTTSQRSALKLSPAPSVLARGNGSASSSSAGTSSSGMGAWAPNVMASYSPWKGVVRGSWAEPSGAPSPGRVESPEGHLRVADAWRPMPTLEENFSLENVALGGSVPRRLPGPLDLECPPSECPPSPPLPLPFPEPELSTPPSPLLPLPFPEPELSTPPSPPVPSIPPSSPVPSIPPPPPPEPPSSAQAPGTPPADPALFPLPPSPLPAETAPPSPRCRNH